jgi:hypothetical protein
MPTPDNLSYHQYLSSQTNAGNVNGPPPSGAAVTPSDSTQFAYWARRLWTGTGGTFTLQAQDGALVAYPNVPAGSYFGCVCSRLMATGTTPGATATIEY